MIEKKSGHTMVRVETAFLRPSRVFYLRKLLIFPADAAEFEIRSERAYPAGHIILKTVEVSTTVQGPEESP
jgi:hypothetical protein